MRINEFNENAANMAAAGMFGFQYYDVAAETTFTPPTGLYISAVQAFEDTNVSSITAAEDSKINIPSNGFTVPEGTTIMMNASKVKIASGSGLIYYGGM